MPGRTTIATLLCTGLTALVLLGANPGACYGRSLSAKLHRFIANVTTPLQADVVEPITPIVKRIAIQGADFPVTSTAPGFAYRFDPELGTFERSESLGPIFLERSDTVGAHHFDFGFSYLYADLKDEGGGNFGKKMQLGSETTVDGIDATGVFLGNHFSLRHHVFAFSGTYGVTNRWDVNLFLPLLYTILDLNGDAGAAVGTVIGVGRVSFGDFFDNDVFGMGDMLARSKYRVIEGKAVNVATALELRLPTGDKDDLQGLGDLTVTPSVIADHHFGRYAVHGVMGFELNTDDIERTRAQYGIGITLQALQSLALLVDVLGSSSFTDDEFSIPKSGGIVPDYTLLPSDFIKRETPTALIAFVPQSNLVDIAVGFKWSFARNAIAFASAVVPVTDDGLRADVVPTGGIQLTF